MSILRKAKNTCAYIKQKHRITSLNKRGKGRWLPKIFIVSNQVGILRKEEKERDKERERGERGREEERERKMNEEPKTKTLQE